MRFLSVLSILFFPLSAYAVRVASFTASGQNITKTDLRRSVTTSSCQITLTNASNTPQVVTYSIKLYALAGAGSNGLASPSPNGDQGAGANYQHGATYTATVTLAAAGTNGANCGSSTSDTCSLDEKFFPSLGITANNSPIYQDVRCEGTISVTDSVAGTPGFITASGSLNTFVESLGGAQLTNGANNMGQQNYNGTGKNNTTAPTFTPIVIAEGRPF